MINRQLEATNFMEITRFSSHIATVGRYDHRPFVLRSEIPKGMVYDLENKRCW